MPAYHVNLLEAAVLRSIGDRTINPSKSSGLLGASGKKCREDATVQHLPLTTNSLMFATICLQRFTHFMLFFSLVFFASTRYLANAHTTLGLHGLSGEDPTGDPPLPEIRGAFAVILKARFNSFTPNRFDTIFEYSTPGNDNDSIWFAKFALDALTLRVTVAGNVKQCTAITAVSLDTAYTFQFEVDETNTARLYQDGVELRDCADMLVPRDVPRDHFLKSGQYDQSFFGNVLPMKGAILGLQVKNLDGTPHNPIDTYSLWDFPCQTFDKPFVASFYARFDDISDPAVIFQRVFDFSNGQASNNIICGQNSNSEDLTCEVYSNAVKQVVTVPNGIVEGEFAFWHFGMEPNGTLWIEKDGVQVAQAVATFQQIGVFRRQLLFGESAWPQDGNLDGVVLGFRLDMDIVS